MSSEVEADLLARMEHMPDEFRWVLQRKWWSKLASRPDANLHRHIKPGKYTMFGVGDDRECLLTPQASLHYGVSCAHISIEAHIIYDEPQNVRGERTTAMERQLIILTKMLNSKNSVGELAEEKEPANSAGKEIYQSFTAQRGAIETSFGDDLEWHDVAEFGWIGWNCNGGYLYPEEEWDKIISRQVCAMNRLHSALSIHLPDRIASCRK